jgi:hypothetical protein
MLPVSTRRPLLRPKVPAGLARFAVSEFVSVLRSAEFMTHAGALPGYEACQAGAIAEVDSVIAYGELPQSGAR